MRRIIQHLSVIVALISLAAGATPRPSAAECPTVTIECSEGIAPLTEPLTFTATVNGDDPNAQWSFNWIVSDGTIVSGQGTPTITVNEQELSGKSVTVKVEVARNGAKTGSCYQTATCTRQVSACAMTHRMFDTFEDISFTDENRRLDHFGIQLQNELGMEGIIIVYGGLNARRGDAEARANRIKGYLVNKHRIAAERLVTVPGGNVEGSSVQLWIGVPGQNRPTVIRDDAVEPLEP